jgi:hypothetical protein
MPVTVLAFVNVWQCKSRDSSIYDTHESCLLYMTHVSHVWQCKSRDSRRGPISMASSVWPFSLLQTLAGGCVSVCVCVCICLCLCVCLCLFLCNVCALQGYVYYLSRATCLHESVYHVFLCISLDLSLHLCWLVCLHHMVATATS